ncbi:OLC1v1018844C1 [Oldenlandia corymbosa var. corymbosa]|uniref:OLC1v1018844C1 n=1 Tax=Oldenlandia corymbosa var. corymbosa TaxID=529605 RepID=A0AAV1ECP0_OLDCO|nr:OLC1v1018844C1 [Oldenlandia corymbosa var. corymbosa]
MEGNSVGPHNKYYCGSFSASKTQQNTQPAKFPPKFPLWHRQMASTETSTFIMSKLELPPISQMLARRFQSSIPFSSRPYDNSPAAKFLIPHGNPRLRLGKSRGQPLLCALIDMESSVEFKTRTWNWRGYSIRYQCAGSIGPALVLVHGFGANSDHWRKNLPVLAKSHRVFSIDLIGYGYSDKPNPRDLQVDNFYTFETWGSQLNDFCRDVVKDQAFFICNSIGGLVGLQAAVSQPQICKGLLLLNISLRMLHITKQPWYARPLIRSFQNTLRNTPLGRIFFKSVATRESVKNILRQCYHDKSQVTDELVEIILLPGLQPGAVDVFLEFICYSGGPLPEELIPLVKVK